MEMTPAPISVERLRELQRAMDASCTWEAQRDFQAAAIEALPALLHQLAELERELHDAEHEVTIMERNLIAAERAREESVGLLRACAKLIDDIDAEAFYGDGFLSDAIAAFLAASGGA